MNISLDEAMRALEGRTLATLKLLHVFHGPVDYHCLDVDQRAPTLEKLFTRVKERLRHLHRDAPLPAASREHWERFFAGRPETNNWLDSEATARGRVAVLICR